jgi:hypothetical protein
MTRFPELPQYQQIDDEALNSLYRQVQTYTAQLALELDTVIQALHFQGATHISTVVTVADLGTPVEGQVAYSTSSGIFRGYVSTTGWVDFN